MKQQFFELRNEITGFSHNRWGTNFRRRSLAPG